MVAGQARSITNAGRREEVPGGWSAGPKAASDDDRLRQREDARILSRH